MSIVARAQIRLKFVNPKQLATVLSALTPETLASETRRAKVTLQKDGEYLVFSVEADDTIALRATLNAYLRWVQSTVNVIEALEPKVPKH